MLAAIQEHRCYQIAFLAKHECSPDVRADVRSLSVANDAVRRSDDHFIDHGCGTRFAPHFSQRNFMAPLFCNSALILWPPNQRQIHSRNPFTIFVSIRGGQAVAS